MDYTENTIKVIGEFAPLAVDCNKGNPRNWGILFNLFSDGTRVTDEAWAVGESFIARWSEFGRFSYKNEEPFLVIEDDMWRTNKFPLSADELRARMAKVEYNQVIRIPVGNVYNSITDAFQTNLERSKVRIIVRATVKPSPRMALLIAKYIPEHEQMGFYHPSDRSRVFLLDKYSDLSAEHLKSEKVYQCGIVEEKNGITFVNAKSRFFQGIEFLMHISPAGFMPESDEELYESMHYEDRHKVQIPFVLPLDHDFHPIHLDCSVFINVLGAMKGFNYIDMFINDDPEKPILLVGKKEDDSYPLVQIALGPLRIKNKGDVR